MFQSSVEGEASSIFRMILSLQDRQRKQRVTFSNSAKVANLSRLGGIRLSGSLGSWVGIGLGNFPKT